MHAVDDDQLGHAEMGQFGVAQPRRDDPGHLSAGRQRRVGEKTHQPDPPAAIDQPDPGGGQPLSELRRRLAVSAVDRAGGAAIDA